MKNLLKHKIQACLSQIATVSPGREDSRFNFQIVLVCSPHESLIPRILLGDRSQCLICEFLLVLDVNAAAGLLHPLVEHGLELLEGGRGGDPDVEPHRELVRHDVHLDSAGHESQIHGCDIAQSQLVVGLINLLLLVPQAHEFVEKVVHLFSRSLFDES